MRLTKPFLFGLAAPAFVSFVSPFSCLPNPLGFYYLLAGHYSYGSSRTYRIPVYQQSNGRNSTAGWAYTGLDRFFSISRVLNKRTALQHVAPGSFVALLLLVVAPRYSTLSISPAARTAHLW